MKASIQTVDGGLSVRPSCHLVDSRDNRPGATLKQLPKRELGQAGEFMTHGQRPVSFFLKRSSDIERIKRTGRRVSTGWFNLQFCPNMFSDAMLGIVIGRRFGTAVRRNRAKRLFREMGRSVRHALFPGYGILVFPKRQCLTVPFAELESVWRNTLRRQWLAQFGEAAL